MVILMVVLDEEVWDHWSYNNSSWIPIYPTVVINKCPFHGIAGGEISWSPESSGFTLKEPLIWNFKAICFDQAADWLVDKAIPRASLLAWLKTYQAIYLKKYVIYMLISCYAVCIYQLNFKTGKNIQPIKLLINRLRVIKTTVVKSAEWRYNCL